MNIAICDDNNSSNQTLLEYLASYDQETGMDIVCTPFTCGHQLISEVELGEAYDVIFLDILMPDLNGILVARKLRKLGIKSTIVFLTFSPDFALDAFSVRAFDYILKPVNREDLFRLMNDLCEHISEKPTITIESKKSIRKIIPDQVEYCEAFSHKVFWHMCSGAVFESNNSIQHVEELLKPSGSFIRVHRSFLINVNYISYFNKSNMYVELESLTRIPIPKAKFSEIKQEYLLILNKGEEIKCHE